MSGGRAKANREYSIDATSMDFYPGSHMGGNSLTMKAKVKSLFSIIKSRQRRFREFPGGVVAGGPGRSAFLVPALVLLGWACWPNLNARPTAEKTLAERTTRFGRVYVTQKDQVRYLYIGKKVQAAMNVIHPGRMVYQYSRLLAGALAAWPGHIQDREPRVLIIGLGAGTMARHIHRAYPGGETTAVELDPAVAAFAARYFGVSAEVAKIVVMDGRKYLEKNTKKFDIIILDAFGEDYIPRPLMTREFYRLVKSRLRDSDSLVLANTWETTAWADRELATYRAEFDEVHLFRFPVGNRGNRVFLMAPGRSEKSENLKWSREDLLSNIQRVMAGWPGREDFAKLKKDLRPVLSSVRTFRGPAEGNIKLFEDKD